MRPACVRVCVLRVCARAWCVRVCVCVCMCACGVGAVVEDCIRCRVDPNYRDKSGNTALMAAGCVLRRNILFACACALDWVAHQQIDAVDAQ